METRTEDLRKDKVMKRTKATGNRLFYSGGHRVTDRGWRRIRKHLQESLLEGDDRHFVV